MYLQLFFTEKMVLCLKAVFLHNSYVIQDVQSQ